MGGDPFPVIQLAGSIAWQEHAACLGYVSRTGVDLFFSPDNPGGPKTGAGIVGEAVRARRARIVCNSCPVRIQCLEFALVNGCLGIWGGTTDAERRRMRGGQAT